MNAMELVDYFKMNPHPEGGFYKETYRSAGTISRLALPDTYSGERTFCTAIMYLLQQGEYSHLHRIRQDEMWHFHLGGPLRLVSISPNAEAHETLLGTDLASGQHLQQVVPGGYWFGATPAPGVAFSLVGCTVAPGFEFADFELGDRPMLERLFPAVRSIIDEFSMSA